MNSLLTRASILERNFYRSDTDRVARALIGKLLVRRKKGRVLIARIIETEAYLGIKDRACHTFGGRRSPRTESMYLDGGHSYVYFIYGMYHCLNFVTRDSQSPEAVLIRAAECVSGFPSDADARSLAGPGKLCREMQIDRKLDRSPLDSRPLSVWDDGFKLKNSEIIAKPRIGVHYAKEAIDWPLRFYLKDHPSVSKY